MSKKCPPNRRSRNSIALSRFSAGNAKITMNDVPTIAQTNSGTRLSDIPGARNFSAVTMKLIAPIVVDTPRNNNPSEYTSRLTPDEYGLSVSGT